MSRIGKLPIPVPDGVSVEIAPERVSVKGPKGELSERIDRDMTVELTQAAKERLIEVGFDPALGARPLRRAMQREIEDQLSEKILHGELNPGDHVKVDAKDGEFLFEHGPRGEKVAVGVNTGGAISGTPDLAVASGE